jgi:hypothetical protein
LKSSGIVAAENALKKENEEKIWQEGILRHVPIVGSVYNWLSPPPKETGIKGRTFHLDAGTVTFFSSLAINTTHQSTNSVINTIFSQNNLQKKARRHSKKESHFLNMNQFDSFF